MHQILRHEGSDKIRSRLSTLGKPQKCSMIFSTLRYDYATSNAYNGEITQGDTARLRAVHLSSEGAVTRSMSMRMRLIFHL